jgi:hypothetical protein
MPSPAAALPLSLVEQYAYTSGACSEFVVAAQRVVGGVPTILVATEPQQLQAHGHPEDEPLELHIFLTLPDGSAVDAEGLRSRTALAEDFGVLPEWDYGTVEDADPQAFSKTDPALVDRIEARLRALGWGEGVVPVADHRLSGNPVAYAWASVHGAPWWPQWRQSGQLPPADPPAADLSLEALRVRLGYDDGQDELDEDLQDEFMDQVRAHWQLLLASSLPAPKRSRSP